MKRIVSVIILLVFSVNILQSQTIIYHERIDTNKVQLVISDDSIHVNPTYSKYFGIEEWDIILKDRRVFMNSELGSILSVLDLYEFRLSNVIRNKDIIVLDFEKYSKTVKIKEEE